MDTNSKKYKTILADQPWKTNQTGRNNNRSAEHHYDLMPLERIKAMPVADLCENNAHLYLWCPNGLLPEALEVVKAWGFTFRSPIYWIKPRLGLGVYIRNASETCLFATRGKAPVKFHAQPNWLFAPQKNLPSSLPLSNDCQTDPIWSSSPAAVNPDGIAGGMRLTVILQFLAILSPPTAAM